VAQLVARPAGSARGLFSASLGVAVVLAACGGESTSPRNDDQVPKAGTTGSFAQGGLSSGTAGAPLGGAGGGTAGAPLGGAGGADVPRLDGVPIGDCREPTDEERVALGCPASPPEAGTSCDLASGVTCGYSLSTDRGGSNQEIYLCSNDEDRLWWTVGRECGELCTDGGPHAVELDASDCASRPADDCELEGAVFAYVPSGYTLLSYTLSDVIKACGPSSNFSAALELEHGCPTRLTTNNEFSPEALACIRETLESKRYTCGELLPCVDYSEILL
jgi:hypothetical protein